VKVPTGNATLADLSGIWWGYTLPGGRPPAGAIPVLYLRELSFPGLGRLSGMLFQTPLTNARIEGDHVRFQFIFHEPNRETSLSFDLILIDGCN